jgi:hypothetical protein
VTLAVLLLTGVLTVLTGTSASAHTGNLPVTAKCNTTTGEYDFTAKLTLANVPDNKTGTTKWRIGTSAFEGTPNSDANMNRGPISTTGNATVTLVGTGSGDVKFSLPGTTTGLGPWFYAFTKWSGASAGSDGQLKDRLKGDCKPPATPKDAFASVTVSPATCEAPGTASVKDKKNATLVGTLDQSVGTHVATFKADAGHKFLNDTDTYQESYVIPGKDTSLCPKAPTAEASAKACVDDGKKTGLVNVTVINTDDETNKTVTYDVTLNGVTEQVKIEDGKSGSVSFDGLAVGDYTASVKGSDGTSTSATVTVPKCDTPIITPPTTPPMVTLPPVPPVKVKGKVIKIDKCEVRGDYVRLWKRTGVRYTVNGRATTRSIVPTKGKKRVVVKAHATSKKHVLVGKKKWTYTFTNKPCPETPDTPDTGKP